MKFSEIIKKVNEEYDMNLKFLRKFTDGFRNSVFLMENQAGNEKCVLIVYKKEENIEKLITDTHVVSNFLKDKGYPVRFPLRTLDGKDRINFSGRFVCLYNYLEGISIPWEAYESRHLKSMGKTLSDLHYDLRDFTDVELLSELSPLLGEEVSSMKNYFKQVEPWIQRKLELSMDWSKIQRLFDFAINFRQEEMVLHMDFVRGNVVFSNEASSDNIYDISGILDFEKVTTGSFVCDIARTLSFLIVDCKYKSQQEIIKWFMDRGYVKRGKNNITINKKDLYSFVGYFWIKDFWKFLIHNPYEYLGQNEHFLRTRDKLIENNYLHSLK